jgi:hypothetical protein
MSRSEKKRREEKRRMLRLRQRRESRQPAGLPAAAGSPGRPKMSEVIAHLAEPLINDMVTTSDDMERVILMTIAAWNLTLFPPDKRDDFLRESARKLVGGDEAALSVLSWVCDVVAERKRRFYPNLKHLIADVDFTHKPDGSVYFEVAYSP